jgi:diphthine synthase
MLTFIGLGLYDEHSITLRGRDALRDADRVFAEFYTSMLAGATVDDVQSFHDVEIEVCDRATVERDPEPVLRAAEDQSVAFLTAGDPMIATTHTDLRTRAAERGIDTQVIHGTTAQAAASSLTGLQNYRFGKATTLPFEHAHGGAGVPESLVETVETNRDAGLHTLVFLDIDAAGGHGPASDPATESYMRASEAAERLQEPLQDPLGIAVGQAGSPEPTVDAGPLSDLATNDYGDPLHMLVIPGDLHLVEAEALYRLASAPASHLPDEFEAAQ